MATFGVGENPYSDPPPQRKEPTEGQITTALVDLYENIAILEKVLTALFDKIYPVRYPEPTAASDRDEVDFAGSDVFCSIMRSRDFVRYLQEKTSQVKNEVQL